jgi:hypothetical protein
MLGLVCKRVPFLLKIISIPIVCHQDPTHSAHMKKISGTFAANVSHKNEITLDRASQHNQGLFLFTLDI